MRLAQKIIILILALSAVLAFSPRVLAQSQVFTAQTLSQYNGKDGKSAYFAYQGKVYDATGQPNWKEGEHYGNLAGQDLTGKMEGAPHAEEVLTALPVVGVFQSASAAPVAQVVSTPVPSTPTKVWYEAPIRIAGLSILAWTGILLAVFFVLNFATCFSMPWSQSPLPWKGARPGPDSLDTAPEHLRFTTIHKYFAWATVITGILHGVIGIMQLFGYRL